jgi:threonine dehydrogenase-like Zn-dependent dehydrogenase
MGQATLGSTSRRLKLILECSGAHAARNQGIVVVAPQGVLVLIGDNPAPWTIEEGKIFRRKDFYMIRTFYFPKGDLEANINLLLSHKDRYHKLVDAEFDLPALPQNFARFASGESIKPVLAFE